LEPPIPPRYATDLAQIPRSPASLFVTRLLYDTVLSSIMGQKMLPYKGDGSDCEDHDAVVRSKSNSCPEVEYCACIRCHFTSASTHKLLE
jgi:hypothetical protein